MNWCIFCILIKALVSIAPIQWDSITICNNVNDASIVIHNNTLEDCIVRCESMSKSECNNLNYFTHLKHSADSRCYIFNDTNNCQSESLQDDHLIYSLNQSYIYYKTTNTSCVNYPTEWTDSVLDDCRSYTKYSYCLNGHPDLIAHTLDEFAYFKSDEFETTALQSCCDCDGGIWHSDPIYWTTYYSTDQSIADNIICDAINTDDIISNNWDEYVAYQLCLKYSEVISTGPLATMQSELLPECNILLDINFQTNKSNPAWDYSIRVCNTISDAIISFEIDTTNHQYHINLNSDIFEVKSFESTLNSYFIAEACNYENTMSIYSGLISCHPPNAISETKIEHEIVSNPETTIENNIVTETVTECSYYLETVPDCNYYLAPSYIADGQSILALQPTDRCINYIDEQGVKASEQMKCNSDKQIDLHSYSALDCKESKITDITPSDIEHFNCASSKKCPVVTIATSLTETGCGEETSMYETHLVIGCYSYNSNDYGIQTARVGCTKKKVKFVKYSGNGNACLNKCQSDVINVSHAECNNNYKFVVTRCDTDNAFCDDILIAYIYAVTLSWFVLFQ